MADREERNEEILRRYDEFRGRLERFRRDYEAARRKFLAFGNHLEEDYTVFRFDDEKRIMENRMTLWQARMGLDAQGRLADPDGRVRDDLLRRELVNEEEKMELEEARRTQFAVRIEQWQPSKTELENCERILEKLRYIEDRYMRIMRKRCIGPYSALDGEYEYLSESSDDEVKVKQRCSRCVMHSTVRQSMKISRTAVKNLLWTEILIYIYTYIYIYVNPIFPSIQLFYIINAVLSWLFLFYHCKSISSKR